MNLHLRTVPLPRTAGALLLVLIVLAAISPPTHARYHDTADDGNGNRFTLKRPSGRQTGTACDARHRPTGSTYSSTPDGPTGIVSTLGYDSRGRKTALSSPDTGSLAYTYNGVDELIEQTDALNQSTTHSYDGLGRLVGRTDRSTNGGITRTSWTELPPKFRLPRVT